MSFTSMHNDYLDPDIHLWPEEPPCERCIHDDPENECCKLQTECNFQEIENEHG